MSDRSWNQGVELATFIVVGLMMFAVGVALAMVLTERHLSPEHAVYHLLGEE